MSTTELLRSVQFLWMPSGNKKAVLLDYSVWELLTHMEDWKTPRKFSDSVKSNEEIITWDQAKV